MKTVPEFIRRLPHPSYGMYCGRYNYHKMKEHVKPVDELDMACQLHDWTGDDKLFAELLREELRIKSLYGKLYREAAKVIFR